MMRLLDRRARYWAALLLPLCFGCSAAEPPALPGTGGNWQAAADPQLVGRWRVVGIEVGGSALAAEQVAGLNLEYEFTPGELIIRRPDRPEERSAISCDATAAPCRLLIRQTPALPAIYAVTGDALQLCLLMEPGPQAGFPAEFASRTSPACDLLRMERISTTAALEPPPQESPAAVPPADAVAPAPAAPLATTPHAPPDEPAADDARVAWRYVDAPLIFPGQPTTEGVFLLQSDGAWLEERVNAPPQDWVETERTAAYVELARPNRGFFVRLFADRSEYRYGNETEFKSMFAGGWETAGR